jgi:hypothetical protein
MVPVAAVLYSLALEARDAIKESTHATAKRCHRG